MALPVGASNHLDMGFAVEVGKIAMNDALVQARRMQVGGLLGDRQLTSNLFGRNRPANPEARRNRL